MDSDPDPPPPRPETAGAGAFSQRLARTVLAAALGLLGLWILHRFLPALIWAVIFAIALRPLYRRLTSARNSGHHAEILAPLIATALVGLVFVLPLVWVGLALLREIGGVAQYLAAAQKSGIPVPEWLPDFPGIGHLLTAWWRSNLSEPAGAHALLERFYGGLRSESARQIGSEIVHRATLFGFMLLALFFLFRDGDALGDQLTGLGRRLLGPDGERIGHHMIAAVHGTVNGLVLVGLAEGVLLGFAYALAGLPHPVSIGVLTGILAVIPFGAPVAFGAAALYLTAIGSAIAAAAILGFGFVVVFIADHFVRPYLIGGAIRLPFLWVLLGILGGIETFGLFGLFLGPVVMAALMSLWRDWTEGMPHR